MKKREVKYHQSEIENVFQKLISHWPELAEFYKKEVKSNAKSEDERLPYLDIGDISRFIVEKKKSEQTEKFALFFDNIETMLIHGDHYVQELIVIGLFEGIQNNGGKEIDYYRSFDRWLKPNSLKAWRELIDFWEKE